jgi:hypothetical protein
VDLGKEVGSRDIVKEGVGSMTGTREEVGTTDREGVGVSIGADDDLDAASELEDV